MQTLGRRGQLVAIAMATLLRRRTIVSLKSVRVSIEDRGGRALNRTGGSLAEVDIGGVDLHVQILGILTCLAATVPSAQSQFVNEKGLLSSCTIRRLQIIAFRCALVEPTCSLRG